MLLGHITRSLALIAGDNVAMSILEERRPIESRLKDLMSCANCSKVSSSCFVMAVTKNPLHFTFRDTPSNDLVRTELIQVWILPYVVFNVGKELLSLLVGQILW